MRKYLSTMFYVYSAATGNCFLIAAALIEFACGYALGGDIATWIAYPAAGLFAIVALCSQWSIIRDIRKYA